MPRAVLCLSAAAASVPLPHRGTARPLGSRDKCLLSGLQISLALKDRATAFSAWLFPTEQLLNVSYLLNSSRYVHAVLREWSQLLVPFRLSIYLSLSLFSLLRFLHASDRLMHSSSSRSMSTYGETRSRRPPLRLSRLNCRSTRSPKLSKLSHRYFVVFFGAYLHSTALEFDARSRCRGN